MTTAQSLLAQIAISLFVAIITAFLTVWLALRRFYREKWWEAKMRAYTDVIQALHHIKRDIEISIPAKIHGITPFYQEWNARHKLAWDDLRKYIDIGEFLFSEKSIQILQTLVRESSATPNDSYLDHMETLQVSVEKCFPAIKAAARADLNLPPLHETFLKEISLSIRRKKPKNQTSKIC